MIYLKEYLTSDRIVFVEESTKAGVLDRLLERVDRLGLTTDSALFRRAVLDREALLSTGIGVQTAIPHVKSEGVPEFFIIIGICKAGVEWDSLDGDPVRLVFLIGGPNDHERYLRILAKLSLLIKNPGIRQQLFDAADADAVCAIFANR